MKRQHIYNCLLCNSPIYQQMTWRLLLSNSFTKTICQRCEQKFKRYEGSTEEVVSLYEYNEEMKDYLHRYKFMHYVILAKVFREEIHRYLYKKKEMIVPIPMHPKKLKERTFSHVDELLKQANIPYVHCLEKISLEAQGGKSREERLKTPQIFKMKENVPINNIEILLVDDIYTTGTTIRHAKELLLASGAKSVKAFTLIRV